MRQWFVFLLICLLTLGGCSPQRFFYYPNQVLYNDPDRLRLDYSLVEYPSLNGHKLYGFFFRTPGKPLGTIVHFHGNYGNMTNHFPLTIFLLKEGFDVLSFDYQGYGESEGAPDQKNTIEDGLATVRYAQEHLRDKQTGVAILGQSLGGAIGIVVCAKEPLVRAAVIEASFTSYRQMSRVVLRRHWFTTPISWVLPFFLSKKNDPLVYVDRIAPRPLFFIHGEADQIVPSAMSQTLYAKASESKKLWIIPHAKHLECRRVGGRNYDQRVGDFFREALLPAATSYKNQ
ncbi:MAG: alpha/beta hydrolase [Elusimicrobiota bacterium]|jgi:hypothetical protein